MQYICLSICTLLEDKGEEVVREDLLEEAYRFTTVNFNYADVVSVMAKGPNPRGKQRKLFRSSEGKELDFDMIYNRIIKLLSAETSKSDKQSVKSHLNNLQTILEEKEEIYRAIEWKEGSIYVLDPLFLFYLRWGRIHV